MSRHTIVAPTIDEILQGLEWRTTPRCELGLRIGLTVRLAWKLRGCRERAAGWSLCAAVVGTPTSVSATAGGRGAATGPALSVGSS